MNTPPEATSERLAWVASLKEGDEVWYACAVDNRRSISTVTDRRREDERPGLQVGTYLLRADGSLSRQGYAAWVEPVTEEDRLVVEYQGLYARTESRLRDIAQTGRYGYSEMNVGECALELKRINKLLDEAGL